MDVSSQTCPFCGTVQQVKSSAEKATCKVCLSELKVSLRHHTLLSQSLMKY